MPDPNTTDPIGSNVFAFPSHRLAFPELYGHVTIEPDAGDHPNLEDCERHTRAFHAPGRRPHLCPKCNGERTVPLAGTQTTLGPRTCPTCLGEGVVWG